MMLPLATRGHPLILWTVHNLVSHHRRDHLTSRSAPLLRILASIVQIMTEGECLHMAPHLPIISDILLQTSENGMGAGDPLQEENLIVQNFEVPLPPVNLIDHLLTLGRDLGLQTSEKDDLLMRSIAFPHKNIPIPMFIVALSLNCRGI